MWNSLLTALTTEISCSNVRSKAQMSTMFADSCNLFVLLRRFVFNLLCQTYHSMLLDFSFILSIVQTADTRPISFRTVNIKDLSEEIREVFLNNIRLKTVWITWNMSWNFPGKAENESNSTDNGSTFVCLEAPIRYSCSLGRRGQSDSEASLLSIGLQGTNRGIGKEVIWRSKGNYKVMVCEFKIMWECFLFPVHY